MNVALLLIDARASHEKIVEELRVIFDKLDEDTKKRLFEERFERLIVPFDLALQCEMLKIALDSTRKRREFLVFLRSMDVFSYDALRFLEEYAKLRQIDIEVSYEKCLSATHDEAERLLTILKAGVAPLWEDALTALGQSDLVINKDVYQIFEDNLLRIMDCFLMVDDGITDGEILKALGGVRENMLSRIVTSNEELFQRS